jgi:hypothetical protein
MDEAVAAAIWEGLPEDLVELAADPEALAAAGARLAGVVTDDFVCVMDGGEGAFRSEYPGADGLMDAWGDWLEPWESYRLQIEDVIPGDGLVLVPVRVLARTRTDGVRVEHAPAGVCFLRGDRVARMEFHLDRRRAYALAGISPPGS